MASDVEVQSRKCRLNENECVSLMDILKSFNSAINEEHAWALCYQCAKCFKNALENDRSRCRVVSELEQVLLHREGHVHADTIFAGGGNSDIAGQEDYFNQSWLHNEIKGRIGVSSRLLCPPDHKVVAGLGLVVFKALDFGLKEEEDRYLAPELDQLIQDMARTDERHTHHAETDDEGIERDSEDDPTAHITLDRVLQCCAKHVAPQPADSHYRNVCRALVTEALDLSFFLDNISQGKVRADAITTCSDLEHLKSSDWARLWVQVIRELRHGVQLKKVCYSRTPIEYQLTPYEILMEDIRSRRYKLNKVMVDGSIPRRVKKDAHAVILEFIRSRPPLRKASERKLSPRVRAAATPREALLESIKTGQAKLRPSPSPFKKKVFIYMSNRVA